MRPLGLLGMLAAGLAAAQTAPPAASVSGVVKDAVSGQPLEGHTVSTYVNARWFDDGMQLSSDSREVSATTDAQGRYRLSGLPPGSYGISARHPQHFGQQVMRRVVLAGKDLEDIDFRMPVPGEIAGRVSDENGEPLPGITVFLVVREYHLGSLHYFFRGIRTTDDRGQYSFTRVAAGNSYLVLAEKRGRTIPARSQAPLNPKLRRRVPMRTWYPGAPSRESAQAVTVAPGERREGVDIEMRKSPSYCVSGVAEGATGPAALNFRIEPLQPSSGSSSRGGVYLLAPGGITDKDGRFRICDLFPGTYRLHADDSLPGSRPDRLPVFGAVEVTVADEDIRDVRVTAAPGLPLEGEVVLEGAQPDKPPAGKVSVWLQPLLRAQYRAESTNTRSDIPGRFSLPSLLIDDYAVRPRLNAPGLYIKDIAYGDRSVRYEPLRMGSAMSGAGLKILVAQDGATLSARVAQKDGAPVADARVLIMPVTAASEGMLAAALVSGKTDQTGQYTSSTLAPGKYYVAASLEEFDPTPESMGRLWRAHNRFQEVELAPKGSAQVNLEPLSIER